MNVETQEYTIICSVCGCKSNHSIIKNSKADDAPDLDLRPSEPHRSSMEFWVMQCPECGYCNDVLSRSADFDHEYINSDEYKSLGGIDTQNELAAKFIKRALVNIKNHQLTEAVQSYLYAAWVFDDINSEDRAKQCRTAAINLIDNNKEAFSQNENFIILKADMLRRCGEFERVITEYSEKKFSKIIFNVISEFQIKLSKRGDSGVYTSDDIPGITIK